jgi:metal-responsive CopG/Arc/MetJ family transcriptional regulator
LILSIIIATRVTEKEVKDIDTLIEKGIALSRADLFRMAVREYLKEHQTELQGGTQKTLVAETT